MRTSPNRLLVLAAAVALVGLLASCSDDKDDKGTSDTTSTTSTTAEPGSTTVATAQPCDLLTPADLEDAFGSPWDSGTPTHQDQTGGDQCVWANTDAPPVKTFSITVYTDDGLDGTFHMTAKEYVAANRGALTVDKELDIADDSFRAGTTVWVLDGSTAYSLSTFLGDSPEAIAGLEALAAKAVAG